MDGGRLHLAEAVARIIVDRVADLRVVRKSDGSTERGKNLRKTICEKLKFASLDFQSLDGIIEAIGMDKNDLCTYCWDGEE